MCIDLGTKPEVNALATFHSPLGRTEQIKMEVEKKIESHEYCCVLRVSATNR